MAKLKYREEKVFRVNFSDLEDFIKEVYGQEFNIAADQELSNDSTWTASVGDYPVDDYDKEKIARFRETGRGMWLGQALLDQACQDGLIPDGDYVVDVSW